LAVDDGALFDPADFVFFALHPQKPASVFEDFERLPIHNFADPVGYGRNTIFEISLPDGDIDRLMPFMA
jgi:hypothetical protein